MLFHRKINFLGMIEVTASENGTLDDPTSHEVEVHKS